MEPIKIEELSPEQSAVVGIAMVAHPRILASSPAKISDGESSLDVPLQFYRGELNVIRTELHKIIDEGIDTLLESKE